VKQLLQCYFSMDICSALLVAMFHPGQSLVSRSASGHSECLRKSFELLDWYFYRSLMPFIMSSQLKAGYLLHKVLSQ